MTPFLTIVDDFLDNPDEIRDGALKAGFQDVEFKGTTFENTGLTYRPKDMARRISDIFGAIQINQSAFRLGTIGTTMNSFVHVDDGHSRFAGVLYLNKEGRQRGGTGFWRHKQAGWEIQPTMDQLVEFGITPEQMRQEWNKPDRWEMHTLAGAKWNRFIYYPTNYFHNRQPFEGFGTDYQTGRLIWVVFFDVLQ